MNSATYKCKSGQICWINSQHFKFLSKEDSNHESIKLSIQNDTRGEYIPKENMDLPCQLAQKDYDKKLYKRVQAELADINK